MPDIRLIALDLDGTVFDDEKRISPRTLAAIRAALDRGIDVLPATGRNAAGVPDAFMQMPGVRFALTSNGASVVELASGRPLVRLPFEADFARRALAAVQPFGGAIGLFVGGDCYSDPAGTAAALASCPPALLPYIKASRRVTDNLDALIARRPGEVEKFSILYPDAATRDAARAAVVAACPGIEATSSIPNNLGTQRAGREQGARGCLRWPITWGFRPPRSWPAATAATTLRWYNWPVSALRWAMPRRMCLPPPISSRWTTTMTAWPPRLRPWRSALCDRGLHDRLPLPIVHGIEQKQPGLRCKQQAARGLGQCAKGKEDPDAAKHIPPA